MRQGDPLLPFLFILAAEGLSRLTEAACGLGTLKSALIGSNRVSIFHLQYADDVVFFCNGEDENLIILKRILRLFELISGLKVKFQQMQTYGLNC